MPRMVSRKPKPLQAVNLFPVDGSVLLFACPLLDSFGAYLELLFPQETMYRRWVLCHAIKGHPRSDDPSLLQAVAFCPGCGMDCRADLRWEVAGRPAQNKTLRDLRLEQRREQLRKTAKPKEVVQA